MGKKVAREICLRCGARERVPGQRWCRPCFTDYARTHRKPYRELPEEQKRKARVRSHANVLLVRGEMCRQPCVRCWEPMAEMRHLDYDDPRHVEWVCRQCRRLER